VNAFVVYDLLQNNKIAEIVKASDPEILGDTLLGWQKMGGFTIPVWLVAAA
jgi:hypothetical protein